MPPSGHSFDAARRKKYVESRPMKIMASVAITVATPHHAVLYPRRCGIASIFTGGSTLAVVAATSVIASHSPVFQAHQMRPTRPHTTPSTPTSAALMSSPTKNNAIPTAATNGTYVSCGISITASGCELSPSTKGVSRSIVPTAPRLRSAGSSSDSTTGGGCSSHSGCRLVTIGISAKLNSGGGEVVAHSSESAFHGSSPARGPRFTLQTKLISVSSTPTANTNEKMLMSMLSESQPRPLWYV